MRNPPNYFLLGSVVLVLVGVGLLIASVLKVSESKSQSTTPAPPADDLPTEPAADRRPQLEATDPDAAAVLEREMEESAKEIARLKAELAKHEAADAALQKELATLEAPLAWLQRLSPRDFGEMSTEALRLLSELDLTRLPVRDEDLAHLKHLKSLKQLELQKTSITDAGLEHLRALDGLRYLGLRETKISAHPPHLDELKTLIHLELGATAVSKDWVEDFKRAHPKCYVRSRWGK